jgi:tRNA G18 (ribose-2'-O)-methylase SpoU
MALGERVQLPTLPELLSEIMRGKENEPIMIVIAEHVSNPDNVGAMFRSALALGMQKQNKKKHKKNNTHTHTKQKKDILPLLLSSAFSSPLPSLLFIYFCVSLL